MCMLIVDVDNDEKGCMHFDMAVAECIASAAGFRVLCRQCAVSSHGFGHAVQIRLGL